MISRILLWAWAPALSGCGLFAAAPASGRPVSEAYAAGHELRVLDIDSPLRAERRLPVLTTPEVFAAYVPAHARGDLLIGDHWIFFKLKEAEWFVERLQAPEPPTAGEASPGQMKPLKDLQWKDVVIPHKTSP